MAKTLVTPPTGSDGQRDYRYSSTGVDLTAPLKFNLNPFDIESLGGRDKGYTQEKWSAFLRFATQSSKDENDNIIPPRVNINDTSLNSQAVWESLTLDLIREFNTNQDSNWVRFGGSSPNRGFQNPLTREDIYAIQRFTQKTDPNAQVDGWLGTQTLRMEYPKLLTMIVVNKYKDKDGKEIVTNGAPELLIPIVWGNKRYVVSNGDFEKWNKENSSTRKSLFQIITLYDPTKHPEDKWTYNFNTRREWTSLAETVSISKSAEKVNADTVKTNVDKKTLQIQTGIKGVLTK
jgi:hypothetical protein